MVLCRSATLFAVCLVTWLAPSPRTLSLAAQEWFVAGSAGLAIPLGSMAEYRTAGPHLIGSLGYQGEDSPWVVRLDGSYLQLHGDPDPEHRGAWNYGDLRSYGVSLNVIRRVATGSVTPYFLFGLGRYLMQIEGADPNPYGWIVGANLGVGTEVELGALRVFVEGRWKLMFSDYAAREFTPSVYLPLSVGLRF